ncbi:MAG TPA: hypothetical protein VG077_16785 [Verrucomicrobiae bacterium]|nr:hypothetical protein [Verrucomicrobiae bacterium]
MKHKSITIIGTLFLVSATAGLFYLFCMGIIIPHSMKLVDCTNDVVTFHLRIPKGNSYSLVLATPGKGMSIISPYQFYGQVYVSDGTLMKIEFPIGSDYTMPCNWLKDSSGLILNGKSTNCPVLDEFIRSGQNYDFKIVFDKPPPSSTSIWLVWMQAVKDKGK